MDQPISIRLLEKHEMPSILPLVKLLNPNTELSVLESRLNQMLDKGYECAGLFYGHELAGVCGLWHLVKLYVGKHIEPDNVVIDPRFRGKGFGKLLFRWVDEYAAKNGCEALELNCYVNNAPAHKFWMNEGYHILGFHFQKKPNG